VTPDRDDAGRGRRVLPALADLERLRSEVAALEALDMELLRKRWRSVMGRPAPVHLSKAILFRVLAYRHQVEALGEDDDITPAAASDMKGARHPRQSLSAPSIATNSLVRPGTLLAREYGGVMHRVMAMETGFTWNGKTFRSLSEVATAITGTKWNGPRFFGLRSPRGGSAATRDASEDTAANSPTEPKGGGA
jgi:hypothetical protein